MNLDNNLIDYFFENLKFQQKLDTPKKIRSIRISLSKRIFKLTSKLGLDGCNTKLAINMKALEGKILLRTESKYKTRAN
ncbi:hypothetical protein BpHYR1_043621 [Brachionus plicatilis]|uniref:Uncharacterized protein n=1 Tax=Brachionus plicatilis TaxID=10195 RepID=A0A3M7QBH7_BRAPC|nr:hypothetical protein BpHYR1_043621 [Brachionus plicatilis]